MLVLTTQWWNTPISVDVYLGFNTISEWFVWQPRFTIDDYRERLYAEIVHRKKELRRKHREKERLEHELLSRGSSQRQSRSYRSSTSEQYLITLYFFSFFTLLSTLKVKWASTNVRMTCGNFWEGEGYTIYGIYGDVHYLWRAWTRCLEVSKCHARWLPMW